MDKKTTITFGLCKLAVVGIGVYALRVYGQIREAEGAIKTNDKWTGMLNEVLEDLEKESKKN